MNRIHFPTYLLLTLCLLIITFFNADNLPLQSATRVGTPGSTSAEIRFVNGETAAPIADQEVWLFCYASSEATHLVAQQWVETDANGKPHSPLPEGCGWVAALLPIHTQPSGKTEHGPAYWLFASSWPTGSGVPCFGGDCTAILTPASGDIVIRQAWPLLLFNVVASLEWQPEATSPYVEQLHEGLQRASLYLADLTDGYMALGPVRVETGGRNWEGADMRFQVANDRRPAAFVGGIVPQTISYTPTATSAITLPTVTLRPAASFFGRYWTRAGSAAFGEWNQPDGFRTLAHEWAHYALFLHDAYQDEYGDQVTCVAADLRADSPTTSEEVAASALSWQYQSSEFWHPGHLSDPTFSHPCYSTDQYRVYGASDWETLARWFEIQQLSSLAGLSPLRMPSGAPEANLSTIEQTLLRDLFNRSPETRAEIYLPFVSGAGGLPLTSTAPTLDLYTADAPDLVPTQFTQVYLLQSGAAATTHLLYQGKAAGANGQFGHIGALTLLGVTAEDDARVLIDRYGYQSSDGATLTGGRFLYPDPGTPADFTTAKAIAHTDSNDLSLDLLYGMSRDSESGVARLTRLTVLVDDPGKATVEKPVAQLCSPDAAIGCPPAWRQTMQPAKPGSWYADFAPLPGMSEFPLYSVVRVSDELTGSDSLLRWFQDVGGIAPSPGHKTGAPASDGADESVTLRLLNNEVLEGECNRVLVMPAAQFAPLLTTPAAGFRQVGMPMDLDILVGETAFDQRGLPICKRSQAEILLRLSMAYDQKEIDRLGIAESALRIFRYEAGSGWVEPISQTPPPLRQVGGPGRDIASVSAPATTVDTDLNWVATTITATGGIYAIGVPPSGK